MDKAGNINVEKYSNGWNEVEEDIVPRLEELVAELL